MNWQEAVEIMVERTGIERYRFLCSDENTDEWSRDGYRADMIRQATDPPGIVKQVANLAGAIARVTSAAIQGQPVRVKEAERGRRWAICLACPELVSGRCQKCGCYMQSKTWFATERCPIGKW